MKMNTQNRKRILTRAQKMIVDRNGLDAARYHYAGENEHYLFLVEKYTNEPVSVQKIVKNGRG